MQPSNYNQRQDRRVPLNLPVMISIGEQVTLNGHVRDISPKSAFVVIKSAAYLEMNDEINFVIGNSSTWQVKGKARISRIASGEGFAIYFTEMDEESTSRLRDLTKQ